MNDKSNIPPVVAEFALEQLASDRCTCCTCGYTWVKGQNGGHSCAQVMEVTVADLRARLAKYEDAEGNPKVLPGGVICANDWFLALPPERQAVLREDKWLLADAAFKAGQSLNSSPVSAGVMDERAAITPAYETCNGKRCGWCSEGVKPCLFTQQERDARDSRRNDRAALSAPSHGEQVREWCEGVEAAVNLIDKKAEDYATEHGHDDMGGLSFGTGQHAQIKADYHSSLIELAAEVLGLIAASPSAGSQGGDV